MRMSKRSEYACLALIDLAERFEEGLCKVADISKRKAIPRKFLEQILRAFKTGGYVTSVRGAEGGYRLIKAPGEISLAEIIRLMDGALAPVESVSRYFYQHSPIERNKELLGVFRDIRDYVAAKLEETTLADLV